MNLRLSHKIPLAITCATVITAGALGVSSLVAMKNEAEEAIFTKMESTIEASKMSLDQVMQSIVADLHTLADNPFTVEAVTEFTAAYNEIGGDAKNYLQDQYITKNANEIGKKHLLDAASDGTTYSRLHAEKHPYFREFLEEHGYYDVFLVDAEGNVVYTVFKELDFATNLKTGEWKDTDLAKLYTSIMEQKSAEDISYIDFAPYAPSNNVPAGFMGRPIEGSDGKFIGALIYQMPIEKINKLFNRDTGFGQTGKILLVGADGLLRNDVRFAKESTILKQQDTSEEFKQAIAGKKGVSLQSADIHGTSVIKSYQNYNFSNVNYALIYEMNEDEVMAPVADARNRFLMIALGVVVIITLLGALFARGVTNAISAITGAMRKVADGHLDTEVPNLNRKDEIGEMGMALQVFKENALAMKQMEQQQEVQKRATEEQKKAAMRELAAKFEQNVKGVVDMVASAATEMDATSKSVTNVAENNKGKLEVLNGQIAGTSKNVQMVSSATTQLSSAINEISGQIARATTITSAAVEEAQRTDVTVQGLTEASSKIGEVLEMINSIAAQINLLALNATIEAARAGEAGKGFAVVASEVKNLAGQTTKATEQIAVFINSIQGATGDTVAAINSIGSKIRDINSIASTIAAAVEEQGAATKDIATNVGQAAASTEEVARNANEVQASSAETGNAAHEMNAATGELSRQAEILRREVDNFLVGIRA